MSLITKYCTNKTYNNLDILAEETSLNKLNNILLNKKQKA